MNDELKNKLREILLDRYGIDIDQTNCFFLLRIMRLSRKAIPLL